jgi:hypothetical protein
MASLKREISELRDTLAAVPACPVNLELTDEDLARHFAEMDAYMISRERMESPLFKKLGQLSYDELIRLHFASLKDPGVVTRYFLTKEKAHGY